MERPLTHSSMNYASGPSSAGAGHGQGPWNRCREFFPAASGAKHKEIGRKEGKFMATYHVSMSVGNGGKAAAHFKYIERTGKYRRNDKLYSESGHLPSWAASPRDFWERTGLHDRRSYREIEFALPNELSREEQKKIVDDFIKDYLPDKAYTYAIHEPRSRLSEEKNPHVHIMFSERIIDDRTRNMTEEEFFKRYGISRMGNEYGGAFKDRRWTELGKGELCRLRENIADRINEAYERNGLSCRVSAKSLEEQKREHYRAGDIEGGLLYKRARPFRAPTESFVRHAGEIAAAGRGELNPEGLDDPAARLRACQEREKVIVKAIVDEIAARNAALEPTPQENYFGTAQALEKVKIIVDCFGAPYRNTEICRMYEKEFYRLQNSLASQKKIMEKQPDIGKEEAREYSVNKAENRLLTSFNAVPEAAAEETVQALYDAYLFIRDKVAEKAGQTIQVLLEEETDRRIGGGISELNRELEKLSYTFRPKNEKEEKKKVLEQKKEELIRSTLLPDDFDKAEQLHKKAEKERWKYISIEDLLKDKIKQIMEHSGMTEEVAAELFHRVETGKAKSLKSDKTIISAARNETEVKEQTVSVSKTGQKQNTPDIRILQRAIDDAERSITRAGKKIADLGSRTRNKKAARSIRGLEQYVRSLQGDIMRWRATITLLQDDKNPVSENVRRSWGKPFVSRYYIEREKLLADAARRRAFLYEKKVIQLSRRPNRVIDCQDEIINEKTEGLIDKYQRRYFRADEAVRRIRKAQIYVRSEFKENMLVWKEVWEKPPLRPMKGRGRSADMEALKQECQTAKAAVTLLRKDYNTPEIMREVQSRIAQKQQNQQKRRDEIRILQARIAKDRRRKHINAKAQVLLARVAHMADRLLGENTRGGSLGADVRISSRRDDGMSLGF